MQASIRCEIIPIKERIYSVTNILILVSCYLQEDECGSEGIGAHTHYWDSACMAMLLISSKCSWDQKPSATLEPGENVTRKFNFSRRVTNIHDLSCSPMCLLNTRLFYAPFFTHIFCTPFSSYVSVLVLYLQRIKCKLLLQLLPSQAFILLVVPYLWAHPAHLTQASRSIKCRGDIYIFLNFYSYNNYRSNNDIQLGIFLSMLILEVPMKIHFFSLILFLLWRAEEWTIKFTVVGLWILHHCWAITVCILLYKVLLLSATQGKQSTAESILSGRINTQ